jgi:hypothetical protein
MRHPGEGVLVDDDAERLADVAALLGDGCRGGFLDYEQELIGTQRCGEVFQVRVDVGVGRRWRWWPERIPQLGVAAVAARADGRRGADVVVFADYMQGVQDCLEQAQTEQPVAGFDKPGCGDA